MHLQMWHTLIECLCSPVWLPQWIQASSCWQFQNTELISLWQTLCIDSVWAWLKSEKMGCKAIPESIAWHLLLFWAWLTCLSASRIESLDGSLEGIVTAFCFRPGLPAVCVWDAVLLLPSRLQQQPYLHRYDFIYALSLPYIKSEGCLLKSWLTGFHIESLIKLL